VSLPGRVGVREDLHERHADAVADRVVAGESVEPMLDQYRGNRSPDVALQLDVDKTVKETKPDWKAITAELQKLQQPVLRRVTSASTYLNEGLPLAGLVQQAMNVAISNYDVAYQQHESVTAKAKEAAEAKQTLLDGVVGVGIGVAVGLIAAAALPEAMVFGIAAMAETGGELAELALGKAAGAITDQHASAIKPLAVNADYQRAQHYAALVELYQGLAVTGRDATSASLVLNGITFLLGQVKLLQAGVHADLTTTDVMQMLAKIRKLDTVMVFPVGRIDELRGQLAAREKPPDAREMEQFIWVKWIAQFGHYEETLDRFLFGDIDVLDNDTIEDYLHGPINVLGSDSLLGVDFGRWTSKADEREAVVAANDQWIKIIGRMERYIK
jgi:hypothetical protein